MDDEKRIAPSNDIGSEGESAFHWFARRQGLLPTKLSEDVGVDFLCQVAGSPAEDGSRPVLGAIVGFSVRTTTSVDGRITLSRKDAFALLRLDVPAGVVLVQPTETAADIHHRMVDVEFAEQLAAFLADEHQTMSLTPAHCHPGARLREDVLQAMQPGRVEQRRVAVARHRLEGKLPIVSLEVRRDTHGALTIVSAMRLYDYFEQLDEADRRMLYLATFGATSLQQQRLGELAVREDVVAELDGLPEPYLIGGQILSDPRALRVEGLAGNAACPMTYTANGDHHGYSYPAGFALTISHRREHEGVWVHEMAALADPDVSLDLVDEPELWRFLAACEPDAVLIDDARKNWRLSVESFRQLDRLAFFARCLEQASQLSGFCAGIAALHDALDDETLETLDWLAALATDRQRIPLPAFVLDDIDDGSFVFEPGRWRVPAVCNTARGSVVAWLQCAGDWIKHEGKTRGIRTREILDVEIEIRGERTSKATTRPEIVFDRSKIAVAFTEQGMVQTEAVEGRGPEELQPEL